MAFLRNLMLLFGAATLVAASNDTSANDTSSSSGASSSSSTTKASDSSSAASTTNTTSTAPKGDQVKVTGSFELAMTIGANDTADTFKNNANFMKGMREVVATGVDGVSESDVTITDLKLVDVASRRARKLDAHAGVKKQVVVEFEVLVADETKAKAMEATLTSPAFATAAQTSLTLKLSQGTLGLDKDKYAITGLVMKDITMTDASGATVAPASSSTSTTSDALRTSVGAAVLVAAASLF